METLPSTAGADVLGMTLPFFVLLLLLILSTRLSTAIVRDRGLVEHLELTIIQDTVLSTLLTSVLYLRERTNAYLYLFFGAKQIELAYAEANGKSFTIAAPDHKTTFISNPQHVKEIDRAAADVLSLFAASKQMFQPQYTMHGFQWVDRRGQDGYSFVRTFRTLLTSHVPKMIPDLRTVIAAQIMKHSKLGSEGIGQLHAFDAVKRTIVTTVAFSFFGQDILPNETFMNAAYDNIEQVMQASEAIRIMPSFLAPFLGKLFSSNPNTQQTWYETIRETVDHRLTIQATGKGGFSSAQKHGDVVQWVIETAPKEQNWSSSRLAHEIMALWYGSIHGLSISTTFALFALCNHSEYAEPLRAELQSEEWGKFIDTSNGLPLLDSFIKESARMQPMDYMTSRRVALKPFCFSNGEQIQSGQWVCMPLKSLLNDPKFYPLPDQFDGFRFARPNTQPKGPSKLTDVTYKWGMWGNTRQACPARFFATVVIKLIMAHFLLNFDIELKGKNTECVSTNWRSYNFPREDLTILLKPMVD